MRAARTHFFVDNFNLNHWLVIKVCVHTQVAVVYEPMPVKNTNARRDKVRRYLYFLSRLTDDGSFLNYSIEVVVGGTVVGFPAQLDGVSCGVFAAILLYHIITGATVDFDTRDFVTWRKFIASKMEDVCHCVKLARRVDRE